MLWIVRIQSIDGWLCSNDRSWLGHGLPALPDAMHRYADTNLRLSKAVIRVVIRFGTAGQIERYRESSTAVPFVQTVAKAPGGLTPRSEKELAPMFKKIASVRPSWTRWDVEGFS